MSKQSKTRSFDLDAYLPVLVILPALILAIYANSLHGGFVFDDLNVVVTSKAVQSANTLGAVFSSLTQWRGLLVASYALNHYFHGNDVFGYHLANVFLHMVNSLLVFFIIERICSIRLGSFCGAVLFACHPIMTAAVASVSGRSSLLCATFYFAALLAFLHDRYLVTAAMGFLALQVKQEALALPVLLLILLLLSKRCRVAGILSAAAVPFVLLRYKALAGLFAATLANTNLVNAGFDATLPHPQFFYTYLSGVVTYLLPRLVFPLHLSVDPDIATVTRFTSPVFLFSLAVVFLLVFCIYRFRKEPLLAYGFSALLISPLLAYAAIPLADPILEHRAYIPMLGIALLFAYLIEYLSLDWSPAFGATTFIALILVLSSITALRNRVYRDDIAFWSSAAASSPHKARPYLNLGYSYQIRGHYNDAFPQYFHALEINPNLYAAYSNIASMQIETAQYDAAEANLRRVIELAPQFAEARINLGVIYLRRGNPAIALTHFDAALALNPDSNPAKANRAQALTQLQIKNLQK